MRKRVIKVLRILGYIALTLVIMMGIIGLLSLLYFYPFIGIGLLAFLAIGFLSVMITIAVIGGFKRL